MKAVKCPYCGGPTKRNGRTSSGAQRWRCTACGASTTVRHDDTAVRFDELLVYCFRHFSRSGRALYLPFQIWDKGRVEGGGRRTTSWDLALDDRIAPPTRSVTWIRQDGRSGLDI